MEIKLKKTGKLLKAALKEWWAKDPFKESTVIAFYAIFSMPGLLIVIITIAGYFFGADAVNNHLASQISSALGADTAKQIQDMIATASKSKNSVWASIIGVITILVGATGVFAQFQRSLNIIWEVKADESKSGIWSLIRGRLFSFGLLVAITFIMMVSFMVTTIFNCNGRLAVQLFLRFFTCEPGSGYGAGGSIVLILLWVSYSSMIVFYGAEFTHMYAELHGGYIPPDKNAVKQQGRR